MNLKTSLLLPLLLGMMTFSHSAISEEKLTTKDLIIAPDTWRKEIIPFPLSFAPSLNYQGIEEIRFAPGWAKKDAVDFWTYTFVWYLDENPQLTADRLQKDFDAYFDGLMMSVAKSNNIPENKVSPTLSVFLSKNQSPNFIGKIRLFDSFFSQAPVILNVRTVPKICPKQKKYLTLFQLSPLSMKHPIWREMDNMELSINCQNI